VQGLFVLVFYLVIKLLIMAKAPIQTCVSVHGVKGEDNLHDVGKLRVCQCSAYAALETNR
jgi:hypothetical protein